MLPDRMRVPLRFTACWMLCWSIIAFAPHGLGQEYQGKQLVRAELLAATNAVVPGKPFTVGLLLRMAPAWHTYWKFSGDAGLPSEMKWKLPAGWKIGEIQWPIPLKTIDPGDIQTYGYENEVLLMQEITPPANIDNERAEKYRSFRPLSPSASPKLAETESCNGKLDANGFRSSVQREERN